MFDDLDDLLDDIPTNKSKPTTTSAAKSSGPPAKTTLNKFQSQKQDDGDFDWDKPAPSLALGSKRAQSAISTSQPQTKHQTSTATFGQHTKAKDNDDDWLASGWDDQDKSKASGGGGGLSSKQTFGKQASVTAADRDDGRSSVGSNYTGFGIRGKKPTSTGKKKEDDHDDLLDNILDDIEEKKGIDTKKTAVQPLYEPSADRRGTATIGGGASKAGNAFQESKQKFKSSADAWGRDTFDDLDDLGEEENKKEAKINMNQMNDKKRALFGLGGAANGGGGNQDNSREPRWQGNDNRNNLKDLEVNKQNTSKSLGRLGLGVNQIQDDYESGYGSQDQYQMNPSGGFGGGGYAFGGTQSNASGGAGANPDSQIDVIETPFSRQRTAKRMAGAGSNTNNQRQAQSQQRPNTGGFGGSNNNAGGNDFGTFGGANVQGNMYDNRVQTSPVGNFQFQPQQQNNFGNAAMRPNTGGMGKPPKHQPTHQQNDFLYGGGGGHGSAIGGDDNILDLLGESKDRGGAGSHKGSQHSQFAKGMGSVDNDDYNYQQQDEDYQDGGDSEDGDEDEDDSDGDFGGYVPTALGKAGGSAQKSQKKPKKSKKKPNKQANVSGTGAKSMIGALSNQGNDHTLSERRAQTISSELGGVDHNLHTFKQTNYSAAALNNQTPYGNKTSSVGSGGPFINASPMFPNQQQAPFLPPPQPMDEKSVLNRQIEDERQKQKITEQRQRKEVDDVREDHKKNMKQLEEKHNLKLQLFNEEKRKLIEEMNKTIELEKEKIGNLHKIDVDNREVQYRRNLDTQKRMYEDQHDTLKKQLEQQVQLNTFAQEISKSSGNINNLVSKLSSEREAELQRREEALTHRDKLLQEKRKKLEEKRMQIESRKKKLALELEDIQQRATEQKLTFEKEKHDIQSDLDMMDSDFQANLRDSRNQQIEFEVDSRRIRAEREKLTLIIDQEEIQAQDHLEELAQQKKQLLLQKEQMHADFQRQERDLKSRLQDVRHIESEVLDEEKDMTQRELEQEGEAKQVQQDNEKLQEALDKYCIEYSQFEREAQKVKEQGERDQIDSEKIGYFKANKDRLMDDLRILRQELEQERESIKEDRVKLEMFKNDLKTRQKTIESLRFDYIKSNQDGDTKYLDDAKDLGFYKIQRFAGTGPTFYPINPPSTYNPKENISPNPHHLSQLDHAKSLVSRATHHSHSNHDQAPRFNYGEYMKKLKEKLNLDGGGGGRQVIGTNDFQMYIMKEREAYLRSLHEYQDEQQPLIQSISQFRKSHAGSPDRLLLQGNNNLQEASFNLGSLQNSIYDKKKTTQNLMNSQYGKSSANSLHFISKNFSNSPVEEVGKDQGKMMIKQ